MGWYAVRSIIWLRSKSAYEERVVLFEASSLDESLEAAEEDARQYALDIGGATYAGLVQAYALDKFPDTSGDEIFSLIRSSKLEPVDYLDRHFDTGAERQHG